ncbi:MAG: hypothetical protein CO056_01000 [Candidatus Tagabacteria bacterium CG_4_9_14_0_2_um_filter_41_11]|uniref:Uncharacterized protein n=2 Tax=Candidatus Tagaibacteriota TaxID=1817918 RepID=A0A2M8ERE6_9BACT|nr:MAG: hypothetical protein COV90_02225 [Candidatus Tagabacteria bacterium CG11_big_fil_rev_8_21_14_0_20_41_11]PJC25304.1 MAG: hypothetical protein CO056_01000 [Candidatus Tagabacteria bacterium CG_4_9_14_0_2_um_filter_41_11]
MLITLLAFIGFIALTALGCFYIPRCCALAFAIYIFCFKLGLHVSKTYEAIIVTIVFLILIVIVDYLDFKNLRLNPFKK